VFTGRSTISKAFLHEKIRSDAIKNTFRKLKSLREHISALAHGRKTKPHLYANA